MEIIDKEIPDVKILRPKVFGDERGFFMETFRASWLPDYEFVQDNHSKSVRNTLRGLHYQLKQPQGKLVRVTQGEVFDVAVDLRRSSATFGQWTGHRLDAETKDMFWVPPGFAHGFLVLSDTAEFQYKCTAYYAPDDEHTILWNDPDLGIEWPLEDEPLLSDKDRNGMSFGEAPCYE